MAPSAVTTAEASVHQWMMLCNSDDLNYYRPSWEFLGGFSLRFIHKDWSKRALRGTEGDAKAYIVVAKHGIIVEF